MTRLDRRLLYAAATSDRFEELIRGSRFLRDHAFRHARRYVAGESLQDAMATVKTLVREGLAVTIDRFGESLNDPADIHAIVDEYRELGETISHLEGDIYLEVVPSHLGIDISVDFFCDQAREIASFLPSEACLEISAEESHRTDRIIEAELRLAAGGVPLVATVQANLHRTPDDVSRLLGANVPIRLVKGAYMEPPDLALRWGEPVDVAFVRLAHRIAESGGSLAIATHDPVIRESLLLAWRQIEIEMLLGVRSGDAVDLVERGHDVRIYVPYGDDWFRYWMRRVAESRGA